MAIHELLPELPGVRVRIERRSVEHAEGLAHAFRDEREFPREDHWPCGADGWSELIELQNAVNGKVAALNHMTRRGFESPWSCSVHWVVFADDRIVGEIEADILEDGMAEPCCSLDPDARGRSIAFRACSLALAELVARPDVRAVSIHSGEGAMAGDYQADPRAMRLIERLGFREVAVTGAGRSWGTFHELPMVPARRAFAV